MLCDEPFACYEKLDRKSKPEAQAKESLRLNRLRLRFRLLLLFPAKATALQSLRVRLLAEV
jgi:hypothetical protein